jgi:putative oxidoreductase
LFGSASYGNLERRAVNTSAAERYSAGENGGNAMSMKVSEERVTPAGEPRLIIPALAPFHDRARDLSWLLIRLTVGGTLLVHGINKLMGPGVAAFASGSLARRGLEPSLPLAYVVFFNETIGAICLMLGLFTRVIAAIIAVEFAVITFVHWPNGYGFSKPGGGWEFPLMWGLIIFALSLRGGGPYSLDRKLGREI